MRVSARGALLCSAAVFVATLGTKTIALPAYGINIFRAHSPTYQNWWDTHSLQGNACQACHVNVSPTTTGRGRRTRHSRTAGRGSTGRGGEDGP